MRTIDNNMKAIKNITYYSLVLLACLFTACSNDDVGESLISIPDSKMDAWVKSEFLTPYNIKVDYRMNSADLDQSRPLAPVKQELVQPFLKAVKKIWINSYINSAEDGVDFMKENAARQLILVGSGSYNQGSVTLGLASNGYTITLYTINSFDLEKGVSRDALQQFFQTMHHEFGHILNQKKTYDNNFQNITGGYTASWQSNTNAEARELGFISNYARSAHTEDFVEVLAHYICYTEDAWNNLLNSIQSESARTAIKKKQSAVSSYMRDTYGVDIKKLREEVLKAIDEVAGGNLD